MDYNFTANMEKQLDDVAEGKLDKLKIIKPLYEYIQEQIKTVPSGFMNSGTNNYKQPEKIGKYGKFDVVLHDGPYGKYVTCDNYKFNLNILFGVKKQLNDYLDAELAELEKGELSEDETDDTQNVKNDPNNATNDTILKKTLEKIESLKHSIEKEWKLGRKKYVLKKGQFGHYIEEWNTTTKKKTANFSMKYLMDKIAKNNKLDINTENGVNDVIEKISNKDIEETVEYFSKSKKNTSTTTKKFVKKE
jgi:hypothetical protein